MADVLAYANVIGPRRKVFVSAGVPGTFSPHLTRRDLQCVRCNNIDEFSEGAADSEARAIIFVADAPKSNPAPLGAFVSRIAGTALDRGVKVVIAISGDDAQRSHRAYVSELIGAGAEDLGLVDPAYFRPKIFDFADLNEALAQECLLHVPGPSWRDIGIDDPGGQMPLDDVLAGSPGDRVMLQRAFAGHDRIEAWVLQARGGGPRAKNVYAVRPHLADRPEIMPFIVKTASGEAIELELGATQQACGPHTPFSHFAPLAAERPIFARRRGALISRFVERASLLEKYIETHSPAVAIASLFDGPLRSWRSHNRLEIIAIADNLVEKGVLTMDPARYGAAFNAAQHLRAGVRDPQTLLTALQAAPSLEVRICQSHGDLHLKNVFVRENAVDIVLIDFNRAGEAPASRDPAELEVSLAFHPLASGEAALPDDVVEDLYAPDLLARPDIPRRSHLRSLAIDQIRRQISGMVSEREYQLMVAAHCLFYARRGDGRAYLAAERLI